jgi:anti-sigma factor RsiW
MNCDELVERLTEFLDGAMEPAAERRVVEHLAECDGCTTYLAQFRTTVDALGHLPEGDVAGLPERARNELLEAFRERRV